MPTFAGSRAFECIYRNCRGDQVHAAPTSPYIGAMVVSWRTLLPYYRTPQPCWDPYTVLPAPLQEGK